MILLRKVLLWSLPIWSLLVWWLVFPTPLTNSVIDHLIGILMVVILLPGFTLVVLSFPGLTVTGLTNHNIDMGLVVIANCLLYSGLLYLFFSSKRNL